MSKSSILPVLITGTILTGACNSIFTKFQDLQCVDHCDDATRRQYFEEPVLQTIQMFIGEMLCWIPVGLSKLTSHKPQEEDDGQLRPLISEYSTGVHDKRKVTDLKTSLLLAIPSTCDLLGTTLMNAGLLYTPVSIYQMTRGSIILFVGLFSVLFLGRKINRIEWTSLFIVFFGVFLVGLAGWVNSAVVLSSGNGILFGMLLILLGIMFSASQFVIEENILTRIEVQPLQLVGWEGLYGSIVSIAGGMIAYWVVGSKPEGRGGQWDLVNALRLMFTNKMLLISSILVMLSISSFNFFGISLTEKMSATARSTIDTSRTLVVWLISLAIGWEYFSWLQLFAFGLMVFGTLVFNGAIVVDDWKCLPSWLRPTQRTTDMLIGDDVEADLSRR